MFKTNKKLASLSFQCCLLLALLVYPFQGTSGKASSDEYELKAALLYKLTRFVEWPADIIGKPQDSFGICVLGENKFGSALQALKGRKVGDSMITIQFFKQSAGIGNTCQLVFISDSKKAFLKPILNALWQQPVLTIGDSAGFAEKGGMIQFTRGGKRIGFKINLQRAKDSQLKIAAPLLELATIVESKAKGGGR